jgi:hypothetical protein
MTTPTETILDHLDAVRDAFTKGGGPLGAWGILEDTCPAIRESMRINTFRAVAPVVLATVERLTGPVPIPEPVPKNFEGWTVQVDSKGYIRLFRKIRAQLNSIYLGRAWSESYARKRIASRALKVQSQEQVTAVERDATP